MSMSEESDPYINGVGKWDENMTVYVKKQICAFYEVVKSILDDLHKFDKNIQIGCTMEEVEKLINEANNVPKGKGLAGELIKAKHTFDSAISRVKELSGLPAFSFLAWKRELDPVCTEKLISLLVRPRNLRTMEDFPLYPYTGYYRLRREIVCDTSYPEWIKWPCANQEELVKFLKMEVRKFEYILCNSDLHQYARFEEAARFFNEQGENLANRIKLIEQYFANKHQCELLNDPNSEEENEYNSHFSHGRLSEEELFNKERYRNVRYDLMLLVSLYDKVMIEAAKVELPDFEPACKKAQTKTFRAKMLKWNRIFDIAEDCFPHMSLVRKACSLRYMGKTYAAAMEEGDLVAYLNEDIERLEGIISSTSWL